MKTFQDSKGRPWSIELTFDSMKRVKNSELKVDLLDPWLGTPPLITRIDTDVELLVSVVAEILAPQLVEASVGPDEFARSLNGRAIAAMHTAFFGELLDFFQSLGRANVAQAIEKQRELTEAQIEMFTKRAREIDVQKMLGDLLGNSAESPALQSAP